MRIGIDGRLWRETGVGRYIRNLVKYLQLIDKKNEYVLFVKEHDIGEVTQHIAHANWRIVSANAHWHTFKEQINFPKILNREQLDLMHFPYFSLPILYKRPFVITIHDLIIHHFSTGKASTLPLPFYMMKRVAYKSILQQGIKHSQKIIVPLHATKDDLQKTLTVPAEKIAVTYEGIDENIAPDKERTKTSFETNGKYFLYVGNAYPHKNLQTLINAFLLFKQKNSNEVVRLLLVGKQDYFYAQLEQQLKDLPDVHIFQNIPDSILHELYQNAVAVVAPSFMEGFGLVPLEALAMNCIVIASRIPSHEEVCGNAAVYFDPNRMEDLFFALENVYRMSDVSKRKIQQEGRERLQYFSWKTMARETAAIYEKFSSK
jgi:glycosyltransferase involved in cell wall biosynthesis